MSANSAPVAAPVSVPERMVPYQTTFADEMMHWQRYLFFRPWYEGNKVADAACGEGYGTDYAAAFASEAIGYDISDKTVLNAASRYPAARFSCSDVAEVDYRDADIVLSFSTISCLKDPIAFLKALTSCKGRIVVSAPNRTFASPGNGPDDRPHNAFHAKEWSPSEFAQLICDHFPDRQVRFLSQEQRWPALIREGLDEDAAHTIAVIGDGPIPQWPRLGIAMPTLNNSAGVCDAIIGMSRFYPGEIEFAVVANGTAEDHLAKIKNLQAQAPDMISVIEELENTGYGAGANRGLAYLSERGGFDYYAVTNDDVVPATDCINELVSAMRELEEIGHNPGVIGPVSNSVNGAQLVDIGSYGSLTEMLEISRQYHLSHASAVTQQFQVRGLFMVIHPKCLDAIGGFDLRFGLGNFEDDDYNLRARLAGFTLWVADGAYLYHAGSTTFKQLNVDYQASIRRNGETLARKWGLSDFTHWAGVTEKPAGVDLYVPLREEEQHMGERLAIPINGQLVDLVHEASDVEFAGWVMYVLGSRPRQERRAIIEMLDDRKSA